jgi:hypothetical protein
LETNKEGNSCLLSGGAPDSHCSMSGADLLPNLAQPTVATPGWLAHQTLSGAHRIVRCPQPTVGAGHASLADCAADRCAGGRWLTGQSGAPPDSPMNFSRTPLNFSRERRLRRGQLTGQSGAPPDSPMNYSHTPSSSPESGRFTLDSSGAPNIVRCTTGHYSVHHRTVRCTQTEQQLTVHSQLFPNLFSPVSST